jgi:hypothetical protein
MNTSRSVGNLGLRAGVRATTGSLGSMHVAALWMGGVVVIDTQAVAL